MLKEPPLAFGEYTRAWETRQGAGAGAGVEGEACAGTGADGVEMGDGKGRDAGRKDRTGRPVGRNLRQCVGNVTIHA